LLAAALLLGLAITLRRNPVELPIEPEDGPRAAELADRLDPNQADLAALEAIPRMGEVRARAIILYREQFAQKHPGKRAFNSINDLQHVHGIGPTTLYELRPYLFVRRPATQPMTGTTTSAT
jgi:hypothetical protein